jgi:hypothetical protein
MATTPPPKPIEELEADVKEETSQEGAEKTEEKQSESKVEEDKSAEKSSRRPYSFFFPLTCPVQLECLTPFSYNSRLQNRNFFQTFEVGGMLIRLCTSYISGGRFACEDYVCEVR